MLRNRKHLAALLLGLAAALVTFHATLADCIQGCFHIDAKCIYVWNVLNCYKYIPAQADDAVWSLQDDLGGAPQMTLGQVTVLDDCLCSRDCGNKTVQECTVDDECGDASTQNRYICLENTEP